MLIAKATIDKQTLEVGALKERLSTMERVG